MFNNYRISYLVTKSCLILTENSRNILPGIHFPPLCHPEEILSERTLPKMVMVKILLLVLDNQIKHFCSKTVKQIFLDARHLGQVINLKILDRKVASFHPVSFMRSLLVSYLPLSGKHSPNFVSYAVL